MKIIATDGYILIRMPHHPHADANGHVREHRIKAELAIGRVLEMHHPVHHVDGDPGNNVNVNLVICEDNAYHKLLHRRMNVLMAGYDPNSNRWCSGCKVPRPIDHFNSDSYQTDGIASMCRVCSQSKDRDWHKNNPDKVKAKHLLYHSRNRERINAKKRAMRAIGKWH